MPDSIATPHPFLDTHAYFVIAISLKAQALAITLLDSDKP